MLKQFVTRHNAIKKNIHFIKNEHSKIIGQKVKIRNKYRKWLKSNLDGLTDYKGDELLEEIINKKRTQGIVVQTKYDAQDGAILTVQFDDGKNHLFCLDDVSELKVKK